MCDGAGRARTVDTRAAACLVGLALGAGLMAEVLASGEFDDVPLANATPSDVDAAVEEMTSGMGVSSRTVNLLDIDRTGDDDTRTATFELIWDLPDTDDEWAYTTTASLSFTGEAWLVDWIPSALHPQLADGTRLTLRTWQAERGDVLGADGTPIVTERPVYRIGIDRPRSTQRKPTARLWS
jgi:NTF2-like N-terminal transpeptidase domain